MSALWQTLPDRFAAHVGITLAALAIAALIALPLGVLLSRSPRLEPAVMGVVSTVSTIPGLALLAFMVPALAALGFRSIGTLPALIALTVYAILPVLRNTVTGLKGVDPAILEAARGVGMSSWQSLRLVELPLALPTLVAGLRTAAVWTVGTATLATPVGASSLGDYIFIGLQTRQNEAVMLGCVAAAALAMLLDGLVRLAERGLSTRRRLPLLGSGLGLLALLGVALAPSLRGGRDAGPALVVGAKTFTEQYILAELLAQTIERDTGRRARTLSSLGSNVVFDALRSGDVDLYVDYTGTLWTAILKREDLPGREELRAQLTQTLAEQHGVHLLASLGFENTYALVTGPALAQREGLRRISQLGAIAPRLRVGGDYEIFGRPEWQRVQERYGLSFAEERSMDPSLMYAALESDQVDLITAFSTDGRIASMGLVVLEDDRQAIPPYDAVVLASDRLVTQHPEVAQALRGLEGSLDAASMRAMNAQVELHGVSAAEVARQRLLGR